MPFKRYQAPVKQRVGDAFSEINREPRNSLDNEDGSSAQLDMLNMVQSLERDMSRTKADRRKARDDLLCQYESLELKYHELTHFPDMTEIIDHSAMNDTHLKQILKYTLELEEINKQCQSFLNRHKPLINQLREEQSSLRADLEDSAQDLYEFKRDVDNSKLLAERLSNI
jgi:capsule polysaccharide export protein KpsE/RkpR